MLTDQVYNVLVLELPVVDGEVIVDLELEAGATGVADNTETAVHVLHVTEAAAVLQSPHLVSGRVLLVSHPDVVLVWLHGQHPPALQHGLDILPGSWGGQQPQSTQLGLPGVRFTDLAPEVSEVQWSCTTR